LYNFLKRVYNTLVNKQKQEKQQKSKGAIFVKNSQASRGLYSRYKFRQIADSLQPQIWLTENKVCNGFRSIKSAVLAARF
jgi:hypothetical protein